MKCVGIQAYGGSLTLAATNAGLTPIAQLESEKEYHRIAARFFDERLVILDQDHKWDEAMQWLESESIDIVYGQPVWKTGNAVNNYVSTNVKEEINDILAKVSQNAADEKLKEKQKEEKNNVRKKNSSSEGSGATGSTTSAS